MKESNFRESELCSAMQEWESAEQGDESEKAFKRVEECYYSLLSESQAYNAKLEAQVERMREALTKITAIENLYSGSDWQEIEEAREIARAALKP